MALNPAFDWDRDEWQHEPPMDWGEIDSETAQELQEELENG